MKLAIMQPYLFPYIGYFQLMNAVDKFVVYDDVTFIKGGWINRNKILVNKTEYIFTIPLHNASSNVLIKDIELAITKKWKSKFLKTLEHSYKKSENFEMTYSIVEDVVNTETRFLIEIYLKSIELINSFLDIKTPIVASSTIYNNVHLKGQGRILDICAQESADCYINPLGGRELYNTELFSNNKIKLKFQLADYKKLQYSQFNNIFLSSLSIIDVMMFNSPKKIKTMLNEYELV